MKITNELLLEHIARYHFASKYVHGRVLDLPVVPARLFAKKCNQQVSEVIGVDIDQEAVKYAQSTYYHPLTTYLKEDVTDPQLPEKLGKLDSLNQQFLVQMNIIHLDYW
ncbi:hypothetical protein ACFQ4A_16455 [Lentibacillus salinarum]|uniref:Uncharacterized protein n=2 Tax=Lentibacillus salinarum TaxID=446820 RepID=A0ABW3ZZI6_9BACI